MPLEGLYHLPRLAVRHVETAGAGAAADEQGGPAGRVLEEDDVPDGAVVHSQLHLGPYRPPPSRKGITYLFYRSPN